MEGLDLPSRIIAPQTSQLKQTLIGLRSAIAHEYFARVHVGNYALRKLTLLFIIVPAADYINVVSACE